MVKVVSNKKQLERLVSIMEGNPDIAKGICGKAQAKKRWDRFTTELNSIGPPVRTCDKWIKVWADLKFKIKKKKTENKTEIQATGGGPNRLHTFSNLEESVIGLLSIDASIDPPGIEFGQEEIQNMETNCTHVDEDPDPITTNEITADESDAPIKTCLKKNKQKGEDERLSILKNQTNMQEDFNNEVKSTMRELKKKFQVWKNIQKKCTIKRRIRTKNCLP
ncbi:uncharacterized protein LOC129939299 [Eupeodes corollae]|uniref:uncharacterized protein LOC129939299 n=1 Tax=Eupeodes corollae TaxID=290404 RepID=UPI002491DD36|nr:uncharacterized protein LOC129939299 [Eupeodes corollae]